MPLPDLTTRELAVVLWTAVLFVWGLSHGPVRATLADVIKATLVRPILTFFVFLGIWTAGSAWLLHAVGLWTTSQLKETGLWFLFTGTVAGIDAATGYEDPDFRKAIREGLGVFVLVAFVVEANPFSLPVELVLVPSLGVVAILHGYAEGMGTHPEVKRLLEVVMAVAGLTILGFAGARAWSDFASLKSLDSARSLLVPPLLSVLHLPALFVIVIQARYDWLFGKIQGGWWYRTYARARLALLLGPRPKKVLEFGRRHAFDLPHLRTTEQLEAMLVVSPEDPNRKGSAGESA